MKINEIKIVYMSTCPVCFGMLDTLFNNEYCGFTSCDKCSVYKSFPKHIRAY